MRLMKFEPRNASLETWDPFAELTGLRRLFDMPFSGLLWSPVDGGNGEGAWQPAVDVLETKEGFVVKAEIPGVKAGDIHLSVENDTLLVKGERTLEKNVQEEGYSRIERRYGAFERRILLPPTVDADRVKASYMNGVLEVQLPKKEEAKPKRIAVQTA
ncbi:MAG: Hsp20/alpha crystallin family protein [Candidatus Methylomirabilales bacterium]